jgi:hypothetical protein
MTLSTHKSEHKGLRRLVAAAATAALAVSIGLGVRSGDASPAADNAASEHVASPGREAAPHRDEANQSRGHETRQSPAWQLRRQGSDQPKSLRPSRSATAQERAYLRHTPVASIERTAKPEPTPNVRVVSRGVQQIRDGAERKVPGSVINDVATAGSTAVLAGDNASQNSPLWPGAYHANPNRQVGRLFFYDPGRRSNSWCSATAVTSQNKSTVVTAGHCVFNPDPDGNSVISGNGYWKQNFVFCPGFEYGCKLGSWNFRQVATTPSWFYGTGARYDFRDDVAVVVLQRDAAGRYLTDAVGSQGVWFNGPTGVARTALGYPATDPRWPQYSYDPNDLRYCQNTDRVDSTIAGTLWIPCTVTGGASGGPWLTWVNGNTWLGYVNSVNSHKPHGGGFMSGPYFGTAEANLYTAYQKA